MTPTQDLKKLNDFFQSVSSTPPKHSDISRSQTNKLPTLNLPRVKTNTLSYGRISVTGDTFSIKDRLKAAGGRWNATDKVWVLPAGTDLAFLSEPLPPPPPPPRPQHACCDSAKVYGISETEVFCKEHNRLPWWFCCDKVKTINRARQTCSCPVHTQSDPHVASILVRGKRYTGD